LTRRFTPGGYPSIEKLARQAEVNPRTIERDIEYLRDMYEAPIAYDR
jgi:predicted DNA-binding transcriptional regulator YafY